MRGRCYSPVVAIHSSGCCALHRASRMGSQWSFRTPAKDGRQQAGDCDGFPILYFFSSAVDKHLKNFGMNIILEDKIFLENEKRETGCFFVLPLQMYRLWVCVPQELYEWRRPAGVCLQQGVFFLCCYLLSASLSSPLMIFHRDTGFMCSMSMQTEFFLSVRSIWSYGEHAINSKTNVHQIPGGLECHVCSIPSKHLRTRSIVIQVFLKQRKQ